MPVEFLSDDQVAVYAQFAGPVDDADVARLSPLGDAHINVHGRYAFTALSDDALRPLRDPTTPTDDE
ncbi:MAG TPA: hypothetical protein VIM08_19060 [Arthrobacter sp.]